ncbi:hypothetical protein AV955_gp062 [Diadromus pulchellus ascovirus 4a]|uniref:Complete DpAV4 genome n=1 Tax=Diadromus pulchellus ascovirus 4a TaxID=158683 RepID=F2NYZ1_9VIRU|nr:hypothetical protein AV955_gp062 [Diadromus pulchellus ascovirus 4a]CCA61419.1 unnamed protein product [Diadromus pulchellus ascovirus 4a]
MIILLKTPNDKTLAVDVEPTNRIETVKQMIEDMEGIPFERQRLFFGNQKLSNPRTIRYYNIPERGTLRLVLRHRVELQNLVL